MEKKQKVESESSFISTLYTLATLIPIVFHTAIPNDPLFRHNHNYWIRRIPFRIFFRFHFYLFFFFFYLFTYFVYYYSIFAVLSSLFWSFFFCFPFFYLCFFFFFKNISTIAKEVFLLDTNKKEEKWKKKKKETEFFRSSKEKLKEQKKRATQRYHIDHVHQSRSIRSHRRVHRNILN